MLFNGLYMNNQVVKTVLGFGLVLMASNGIAGETQWTGGGPLPPANTEVKALAKMPDGRLMAGTKSGGIYISDTKITKWVTQPKGLTGGDGQDAKSIALFPDGKTLLVGTKDGVFRSTNGGESFIRSSEGLSNSLESLDARFLTLDPINMDRVYLTTKAGFYYSEDQGLHWIKNNQGLNTPDQEDLKLTVVRTNPYKVLVGSKNGLYQAEDPISGVWTLTAPGFVDFAEIKVMAYNSDFSSLYIYAKGKGAPSLGQGVYRSDDDGKTFIGIPLPSNEEVKEYGFAVSPDDPKELLASDKKGNVYLSTDRGVTWEPVGIPGVNGEIKVLMRDPANPDQIWYAGTQDGFFKTTNGGDSWTKHSEGLIPEAAESKHIVVDPNDPLKVYVGTKTGLWFSTNGAETVGEGWVELSQEISTLFDLDTRRILVDFSSDPLDQTIFLAAKFDLFKRTRIDNHLLWVDSGQDISLPPSGSDKDIKWITQDPENAKILYICRKIEGGTSPVGEIYRSEDEGANWTKISDDTQFTGEKVGDIKNIILIGNRLFVGTKNGIYRGDKNAPLPIRFDSINEGFTLDSKNERKVESIDVSPAGSIFISTGSGIFMTRDGGDHWSNITGNMLPDSTEANQVESAAVYYDPLGRLWAGTKRSGIYMTTDPELALWTNWSEGLDNGKSLEIKCITSSPSDPTRFYIGTKTGTYNRIIPIQTSVDTWRVHE